MELRGVGGTPQGSVMSPLSFIVYINDIFGHLGIDILRYADDLVIFDTGQNLNHVLANVQNALDTLVEGLNDLGLQLSPSKTKVMFFRLRNRMRVPSLILHWSKRFANIYIEQYISKYSSDPYLFTKYGQVARDNRIVSTKKPLQYLIHFEAMVEQTDVVLLSVRRGADTVLRENMSDS